MKTCFYIENNLLKASLESFESELFSIHWFSEKDVNAINGLLCFPTKVIAGKT